MTRAPSHLGVRRRHRPSAITVGVVKPLVVVDAANVLKAGATAGAAVMTFGLSTLAQGVFDKQTADPRPCDTALGKAPAKAAAMTNDVTL